MKDEDRAMAEYTYKFYQDWTSGRLPRMILLMIQNANPYYDDSYAVNSPIWVRMGTRLCKS